MNKAIETNTLRDWLESHQPVTVLDVPATRIVPNGPFLAACTSTHTRH